ncbi:MAG: carbonic anhydrase [SAR202 cluster bacterium]|nr:carbonic anhydrase [SAR202 cluster bacterium]
MPLLDDVLAHNERFVADSMRPITRSPAKRIAIFTCMDTRLIDFLEPAMGLGRGDAKVIKNAGTTVIDSQGGVIRSLVVAVHALGCEEIYTIGHLDCGMGQIDERQLERRMLERGISPEAIAALHPSLGEWLGTFRDVYGNVRRVTQIIRDNPLIPNDVPVHGLMFDPASGRLELLMNGYRAAPNARPAQG